MPIIPSSYTTTGIFKNAHINTMYPAFFRRITNFIPQRYRLDTPDGDFLDLDCSFIGSNRVVLIFHGLEGTATNPYMQGMAKYFNQQGWDSIGVNFRGCSGEPNRLLRSYHVGETGDLHFIIEHCLEERRYQQIGLVGFSLGGNVILKYLGEAPEKVPAQVVGGVGLSVPCYLEDANRQFLKWSNFHYLMSFLLSLQRKMRDKANHFPELKDRVKRQAFNIKDFDDRFTAPINGYKDAIEYWTDNSSYYYLEHIQKPALMLNALDDTFMTGKCYPRDKAVDHSNLFLEMPEFGGHIGFTSFNEDGSYWSEIRAEAFLSQATM